MTFTREMKMPLFSGVFFVRIFQANFQLAPREQHSCVSHNPQRVSRGRWDCFAVKHRQSGLFVTSPPLC